MRIVYHSHGTSAAGGIERILTGKANYFAEHGHEVVIVTTDQIEPTNFFPLHESIKRVDLDIMYYKALQLPLFQKIFSLRQKRKLHRRRLEAFLLDFRPDITITTFYDEKTFLHKIKDGSKKIAEYHTTRHNRLLDANRKGGLHRWLDKIRIKRESSYAARYDRFIVLTEEEMGNWQGLHNIEHIPNFVTITPPEQPASLSAKSMIAAGRLDCQKGYERMIAAWNIINTHTSDWKLHIYGAGSLQSVLQHEIEARHLESVITIHKPEADIVPRYLENSAYLMSSRWEGMPLVLLEAMACGLPLISFTCPCGPRDLIQDGYNGLLVPEGDIEGLANAIIRVIEDKELRTSMGHNAIEESKKYLIDNVMVRWEKLFRQILSR